MTPPRLLAFALLLLCGCPNGSKPTPGNSAKPARVERPPGPTIAEPLEANAVRLPGSDFVGVFSDGSLTLELEPASVGLSGTFAVRGQRAFPAAATAEGQTLNGAFEAKGKEFPFRATWLDGVLLLSCDGREYRLQAVEPSLLPSSGPPAAISAVSSGAYVGTFVGTLNGSRATLRLQEKDEHVHGSATDANAYRYTLRGTRVGARVEGEWIDPSLGKSLPFALQATGDGVLLTFSSEPAVSLDFRRSESAPLASAPGTLDRELLGTWVRDTGEEKRITIEFRADGTYTYGHSRSTASGSAVTGNTATGQLIAGRWRSNHAAIFTSVRAQGTFGRFAGYELARERLVLTFEGTGAEIWRRP